MDHFDRVLGGMFASLLAGFLLGYFSVIPFLTGLFGGSLLATIFLWDAIIRNPPVPSEELRYSAAIVVWHCCLFVTLVAV
ncbi:hypothetical protein [Natrinema halophilum]|uniref:Uncharacterized protein n=1 Tax=Natrinema halophilum TaxID=1699371 RepID=A0A7D5GJT3_9EURY|nr:hypothetical protein [Natrinema halophilum]QLG50847.1 hypothetical protein HYG82_19405 [Natrinema halophilum]